MRTCSICIGKHYGLGLCSKHYQRFRATGSALSVGSCWDTRHQPEPEQTLAENSEWIDGCLIYTKGKASRSGHVQMRFRGRQEGVHRVSWVLVNGDIPDGFLVRHSCDTPRCIWSEHLILGTVADNNRDRDERGRHVALKGSSNGMAKLTDDQVLVIRERLAARVPQRRIAAEFGVSQGLVSLIKRGKAWAHLGAIYREFVDTPLVETRHTIQAMAAVKWPALEEN